jgi:hypothetical protein
MNSPRFALGPCVATPGALAALEAAGQTFLEFLARHQAGDWGELDYFHPSPDPMLHSGAGRPRSARRRNT